MSNRIRSRVDLSLDPHQDGAGSSRGPGGEGTPPGPHPVRRRGVSGGLAAVVMAWVAVAAWAGAAAGGNWAGYGGVCLTCCVAVSAILLRIEAECGGDA